MGRRVIGLEELYGCVAQCFLDLGLFVASGLFSLEPFVLDFGGSVTRGTLRKGKIALDLAFPVLLYCIVLYWDWEYSGYRTERKGTPGNSHGF